MRGRNVLCGCRPAQNTIHHLHSHIRYSIDRFDSYKHFSAYCGLVPWVQTSNESIYYGRITKRGPQKLRTALVQCVVAMVRMEDKTSNYKMMHQYQELKNDKSSGKAIIATARKLSRIIYIMLKSNTPFDSRKTD